MMPRETRDDAQAIEARQPLEHPLVTCHDVACWGMKLLRHPPRIDLGPVGHELEQQLGLRLDHLPEAEPSDARRLRQRLVGPLVERLERRVLERAPGRPVRRVEARAPVHAVGIEGPAEVEEDDLDGASDAGGPRARAPPAACTWSPPSASRARRSAAW